MLHLSRVANFKTISMPDLTYDTWPLYLKSERLNTSWNIFKAQWNLWQSLFSKCLLTSITQQAWKLSKAHNSFWKTNLISLYCYHQVLNCTSIAVLSVCTVLGQHSLGSTTLLIWLIAIDALSYFCSWLFLPASFSW